MQQDREIVERGPVRDAAFDQEGNPTKAAAGFARAKGIAVEQLEVREHEGREFVFAVRREEGAPVAGLLPEICAEIMRSFSFPKTMKWDGSGLTFSRPVRWLMIKFGEETISLESHGIASSAGSRGHRFLGQPMVTIDSANSYGPQLASAGVIVDQEERRRIILDGLSAAAGKLGGTYIDPAGEIEEVIYLVENPSVQTGSFDAAHLRLPARVLVTAMQSHQRYFPLTDEAGQLMPSFLYVMNADPAAAAAITAGNERVLEGRIEDAEFSFDQDLKVGIEQMAERLGSVVFHQRLGSLADKTARLSKLVQIFADLLELCGPDLKTALAAARLAKADQVSIMVQEFSELEGHIGAVYAQMEGFPSDVCAAIEEHYLPDSSGGELPKTVPGAVLSICEKIDNIMGAFAISEVPSGSRDPYGLRRAAAGVAAISRAYGFDFDLVELLLAAQGLFLEQKADISREAAVSSEAFEFMMDRIQHRLVEQGTPVEIVEAARASGVRSVVRLIALVEALEQFRLDPRFEDLHTAYFRSSKIAAKAGEAGTLEIDPSLFQEEAERLLHEAMLKIKPRLEAYLESRDYRPALELASTLRQPVDRFFDDVMVMDKDEKLRRNRLALLSMTAAILMELGDPMKVAAAQ
jgi:glycyl-tRNA synthetase beta chain